KNVLAIARDVQIEPVRREIQHLDLIIVKRGEKIEVEVPVHVVGEAAPGTMVSQEESTIAVLADAATRPERIEVSIEGGPAGEYLLAGQVELPAAGELVAGGELRIVDVSEEIEMDLESDAEEETAEAATAEAAADEKSGAEEASEEE